MTNTTAKNVKPALKDEVQGLLSLIGEFGGLLARETEALRKMDFAAVDALQANKRTLARRYHDQVAALGARRDEVGTLDLALRERLVRARTEFTIVLNDNLRALDATKSSAKRLVDRILDAAQRTVVNEKQTHYSAKGNAASWKTATLSLSVDQSL